MATRFLICRIWDSGARFVSDCAHNDKTRWRGFVPVRRGYCLAQPEPLSLKAGGRLLA